MLQFRINVRRVILGTRISYWFAHVYSKWFLEVGRSRGSFARELREGGLALRT